MLAYSQLKHAYKGKLLFFPSLGTSSQVFDTPNTDYNCRATQYCSLGKKWLGTRFWVPIQVQSSFGVDGKIIGSVVIPHTTLTCDIPSLSGSRKKGLLNGFGLGTGITTGYQP